MPSVQLLHNNMCIIKYTIYYCARQTLRINRMLYVTCYIRYVRLLTLRACAFKIRAQVINETVKNVVSWLSTYPSNSILPHIGSGNTVSPLLQTVSTRNRCSTCMTTSRKWARPLGIITCRTIGHLTGSSTARDFTRTRTAYKLDSNNITIVRQFIKCYEFI